jgi:hypothetical protein
MSHMQLLLKKIKIRHVLQGIYISELCSSLMPWLLTVYVFSISYQRDQIGECSTEVAMCAQIFIAKYFLSLISSSILIKNTKRSKHLIKKPTEHNIVRAKDLWCLDWLQLFHQSNEGLIWKKFKAYWFLPTSKLAGWHHLLNNK